MKITLVSFLVLAVVVSLMQQIHAALDPPSNILKDYIDAKIEAVTENNLNRIFSRMDENTRELLRKIEDVNTKIDNTSTKLDRIDVEFQSGKLALTIVAAFLGLLAASNFGVFLKQVVQPFFTK